MPRRNDVTPADAARGARAGPDDLKRNPGTGASSGNFATGGTAIDGNGEVTGIEPIEE